MKHIQQEEKSDSLKGNLVSDLNTATHAVKVEKTAPLTIGENAGCSILAQAQTNKATMLCLMKEWKVFASCCPLKTEIHKTQLIIYKSLT